ncbi:MAG: Trigger factor [Eubacteriales bacterium SKADARSKE-1]|nr:Trigger factor [Eubacteriales bacterium SKADARSKE-1]
MNLKSSNKIDTNRFELEVEINQQDFEDAVNKAFLKNRKKILIPGFRKGKAPRAFIEKYYGENVFYEDAVNDIYPKALDEAIEEAKLDVINDKIDFDIVKIGKDGFIFKACVTVKPEVNIDNYKGLEISEKSSEVTEEDLEKEIDSQREKSARFIEVQDRAAQNGDIVVIDFKGFVDGKEFEGGMAENHSLKLGSNQFIPGFEDQIIGHHKDEEFDINVTFPEDYAAPNLAGKPCVFKINLHEIKEKELPKLDDEFVKDISEFDTLEEYKADLKAKLAEKKESESKDDFDNKIIDKVISLLKAEIPEAMFEQKVNENLKDFANRLSSQGLDMTTYMKYTGMDAQSFKEEFRPMAERQVKLRLALEKIAELENLVPTEEEFENKYKEFSELYKLGVDKIKSIISEKDLGLDLSCEKAIDFLRGNAVKK